MRFKSFLVPPALLALAACGGGATPPWDFDSAFSAAVDPGGEVLLRVHAARIDATCAATAAPTIRVLREGQLGAVEARETTETVTDPTGACDPVAAPATAVYYAASETSGFDSVVYAEEPADATPDRVHRADIRVR